MQVELAPDKTAPSPSRLGLFLGTLGVALFVIALAGQPNLLDNERRIGAYVLDAVQNGHWLCQRDITGEIASKPPAITWVAALSTLGFGRLNRFSIYLASAAATLVLGLVLLKAGREHFGWRAGFLAGLMLLLSPMGATGVATARYDALFALPVTWAALAAFRSWTAGKSWLWFWLAASFGMLVKGPLGLILGAAGLLAVFWEKRSGEPLRLRGSHWLGAALYLGIGGAWFAGAYSQMGQPFIDKVLGRELVGHIVNGGEKHVFLEGFLESPLAFLSIFAPWSLLSLRAFWRVWKQPATDSAERRFERFLFCWFFVGLLLFCVAAHQRSRLILPLVPAAALLAGRELDRLLVGWSTRRLLRTSLAVAASVLAFLVLYRQVLLAQGSAVKKTLGMRQMAALIRGPLGEQFPLTHVDSPFALQFYINSMRGHVSAARAAELLRGQATAVVAVGEDYPDLIKALGTNTPALHELARWPKTGPVWMRLVSNHARLEWTDHMAARLGPLALEMEGVRHLRTHGGEMVFERIQPRGAITFRYEAGPVYGTRPLKVRVRIVGRGTEIVEERELNVGDTWRKETGG